MLTPFRYGYSIYIASSGEVIGIMIWSWISKNFTYLRYSLGISMMINGFPVIFFFRDTLHVGPASSLFTAIFFSAAILLMIPGKLFSANTYKPNTILLAFALSFLLISMVHFFYMNPTGRSATDVGNYGFFFLFLFFLMYIPNDARGVLMHVLFFMSLFSNFTLVYSLITNPSWTVGMRAAVTFANEGAQAGGNPHIAARNALICLLSSQLLLGQYRSILFKVFFLASSIFSVAVMVLTQSKTCILGTALILFFHLFFTFDIRKAARSTARLFTFKSFAIVLIMIGVFNYLLNKYYSVYSLVISYWDSVGSRLNNVLFTAFGFQASQEVFEDASAMGRVKSINFFADALTQPDIVLIGMGYKMTFMDVPLLEAWTNHGILGFITFGGFNFYLFIFSLREIRRQGEPISLFCAYFFIYLIVLLVAAGRPYDVAYWFPYAFLIRFLGIKYLPITSLHPPPLQKTV